MMSVMALGWIGRVFESRLARWLIGVAGVLLVVVWFYNWAEDNGESKILQEVNEIGTEELQRQITVLNESLRAATQRAAISDALNQTLEREVYAITNQAQAAPEGNRICLSSELTDRLRDLK